MSNRQSIFCCFVVSIFALLLRAQTAQGVTLTAIDQGWYTNDGEHVPSNTNYIVGDARSCCHFIFNDFFVFDLTSIIDPITSATLKIFNPSTGYVSPDASEGLSINDVSTPIATLVAGTGGVSAFNDLGSGTQYGLFTASAAFDNTVVSIPLNAAAIAALNAATSTFAFGGNIYTLNGLADNEYFFGDSNTGLVQLELVTGVPEPSSLLLMGVGLFGIRLGLRRASNRKPLRNQ